MTKPRQIEVFGFEQTGFRLEIVNSRDHARDAAEKQRAQELIERMDRAQLNLSITEATNANP